MARYGLSKGRAVSTDSNLPPDPPTPDQEPPAIPSPAQSGEIHGGRLIETQIEDELKDSYLIYSMSVIVSRALPDAHQVRQDLRRHKR
jgi:hypothetical protein